MWENKRVKILERSVNIFTCPKAIKESSKNPENPLYEGGRQLFTQWTDPHRMGVKLNYIVHISILPDIFSISVHLVLPHDGQSSGKISRKCSYYKNSEKIFIQVWILLDGIFLIGMVQMNDMKAKNLQKYDFFRCPKPFHFMLKIQDEFKS